VIDQLENALVIAQLDGMVNNAIKRVILIVSKEYVIVKQAIVNDALRVITELSVVFSVVLTAMYLLAIAQMGRAMDAHRVGQGMHAM
jgi:hypothetical protein